MTETIEAERPDFDPLDSLTLAELDAGSRMLKASIVSAIVGRDEHYEKALAVLAYLHERRVDRTTKPDELLKRFTAMRYSELSEHLKSYAPAAAESDATDPTQPGPG